MKFVKILFTTIIILSFASSASQGKESHAEKKRPSNSESYLLNKYSKNIKKNEEGYKILPDNGEIIQIKNCLSESCRDGFQRHSLIEVKNNRYAIINSLYYEWQSYSIIDLHLGYIARTKNYPHFSPDLKRFVSTEASEMGDGSSIELYELKEDKYELVFEKSKQEYFMPEFKSWKNDNEINIEDTHWIKDDKTSSGIRSGRFNMILSHNTKLKKWEYKEINEIFSEKKNNADSKN